MNTRNGNGPEPGGDNKQDSLLRRRLTEQSRPDEEPLSPRGQPARQRERLAELTMAETREFSEPRMSERLADSIAPVANRTSALLGGALRGLGSGLLRALRASLSALLALLRGTGAALGKAMRALGVAFASALRASLSALLALLRALRSAALALPGLAVRVAAVPGSLSAGGASGALRLAKDRLRQAPAALIRLARKRPRLLVAGALWLVMIAYGASVLEENLPILSLAARDAVGDTGRALLHAGAGAHRTAELLGLVRMPEAEPAPVKPRAGLEQPSQYVLRVVTEPAGATVSVAGDRFHTPGEVRFDQPDRTLRVRISKHSYRTVWRRVKPEEFQAEGEAMLYALNLHLERPKPGEEPSGIPAEAGASTGMRKKRPAGSKGPPTIWLEPLPPRPSPAGARKPQAVSAKPVPVGRPADRGEPSASEAAAARARPTVWLEPLPPRKAPRVSSPTDTRGKLR